MRATLRGSQPEVMAAAGSHMGNHPARKAHAQRQARPPTKTESTDYLRKSEGLQQLKAREEREIEEAKQESLSVGQHPASAERQQQAAAPGPKVRRQPPPPKKSEAEIEAERRVYQVQQDARDYRLKLMNLQQSAESIEAFLKSTLARKDRSLTWRNFAL